MSRFQINTVVRLRGAFKPETGNLQSPTMLIIGDELPHDDRGFSIPSQRVFWTDRNDWPHDRLLPIASLEAVQ